MFKYRFKYRFYRILRLLNIIPKKKFMAMFPSGYKIIAKSNFNIREYLKQYPHLEKYGLDPVKHYLRYGWKNDKNSHSEFDILYSLSSFSKLLFAIKHKLAKIYYHKAINRNNKQKILVILHLFYMHSWDSIKEYLKNLELYNYELIVTCINGYYTQETLEQIKTFHPNTIFFFYENKGFDIGPFVDVLGKINLDNYDIIYKIQSKGVKHSFIYIYNQVFKYSDWFKNLFEGILGPFSVHKTIEKLSGRNNIGLVAAKNLIIHDPVHKEKFTQENANKLNIDILNLNNYLFVAGSCFAVRSHLLKPIQNLHLNIDNFVTNTKNVFSFAHAMERIVCACVETQGYQLSGNKTMHPKYSRETHKYRKYSAIRLLKDDQFELDYEFFYKVLETSKIKSYEIKKIKLKDIKRKFNGRIYSLSECSPFAYLNGDKERYKNYCRTNLEIYGFDMNIERYETLLASLNKGFNFKQLPVLNADNIIMDGQHRCCYLLKKYGEDYEVPVLCLHF